MVASESSPIVVNVTPTFSDSLRFNMRFTFRRMRLIVLFSLFWLCAYLLHFLLMLDAMSAANVIKSLPALCLPAFTFVLLPVLIYRAVKRQWRGIPEFRERKTYTFTDGGIHVAGATSESSIMWSVITIAQRVGEWAVLGTGQGQFYVIPVEAFGTDATWDRFRRLVEEKVSACRLS